MDITKEFTMYIQKNNIEITSMNYDLELKKFKEKIVSECKEMEMCGYNFQIGDYVKVEIGGSGHLSGGRLEGKIKEFYPYIPQIKLETGWCFHPKDEILIHKPINVDVS